MRTDSHFWRLLGSWYARILIIGRPLGDPDPHIFLLWDASGMDLDPPGFLSWEGLRIWIRTDSYYRAASWGSRSSHIPIMGGLLGIQILTYSYYGRPLGDPDPHKFLLWAASWGSRSSHIPIMGCLLDSDPPGFLLWDSNRMQIQKVKNRESEGKPATASIKEGFSFLASEVFFL